MTQKFVTGAEDVQKALDEIGGNLSTPLSSAIRKAMRPVLADAKTNIRETPRGRRMASGLKLQRRAKTPKAVVEYRIGATRGARWYSLYHLLELGTAPHWQPNRGWQHPGSAAHPWLRPAWEGQREAVMDTVAKTLGDEIKRHAERVAARRARRHAARGGA